jgi:hypothetical protein
MKCPYLIKLPFSTCIACEKPYLPSIFQLHEYCKGKYHKKCPFFLKLIIEKGKSYIQNEKETVLF